jgi:hypothetical protein
MDVGGFVLKSAAGESKSLFSVSPSSVSDLAVREVVIADGVLSCVAPFRNYVAFLTDRTSRRRDPLRPCVREVRSATVGWDIPQGKLFLRLHISPGPHYLSAHINIFPAIFILIYFHRIIGGGAVGKADKLVVGGPISSQSCL